MSVDKGGDKKDRTISKWSGHYPRRLCKRTLAIALKMSLLIFQNAKLKFAFADGTVPIRLKAAAIQVSGFVVYTKLSLTCASQELSLDCYTHSTYAYINQYFTLK